jgi:predicted AAA+ superfamily ATPase
VERALLVRRVVLLTGARQCGKTTLAKKLIHEKGNYRTLDDPTLQRSAENDPQGFVKNQTGTLIIDEVQRVPVLIQAIKKAVDEDNRPGQYLLTGSANLQSLPGVTESLAGRIHKIRLRPLTQGEILGKEPQFLSKAFNQDFAIQSESLDRDDILTVCLRGGYPEAVRLSPPDRSVWHRDYINALIERDLKDITKIQRHSAMHKLIKVMAVWSSKFMDVSAIGTGLSITRPTLESYLNALEALYITETVQPWSNTNYGRVGKQSKAFMTDSGLMSSLLNWRFDQVRLDPDCSGKAIETFIFNEIAAQVECGGGQYELFHYRDRDQREIDFIVERDDGALLGIEVKAGSALGKNDFKHLKWFKDHLAGPRPFVGISLYTGEHVVPFGENQWGIPMGKLWG